MTREDSRRTCPARGPLPVLCQAGATWMHHCHLALSPSPPQPSRRMRVTEGVEIRRIEVQSQSRPKVLETLSQPIKGRAGWCMPVIPATWGKCK
jgi:hypothetical protein